MDAHSSSHKIDLEWLNTEVEAISHTEPERSIVMLLHYSPTTLPEPNDPEHLEDNSDVGPGFVTNLDQEIYWTSTAVKTWASGHTHFNCDLAYPKTGKRVVANQRRYGREDSFGFDSDKSFYY